jgi:hypothetical protein
MADNPARSLAAAAAGLELVRPAKIVDMVRALATRDGRFKGQSE